MDIKEKANTILAKLPFTALAEKIPAAARAKVPALHKAMPLANHIACALALVIVVTLIACGGGKGGSSGVKTGGKEAKASDFKYEMNKAGDGVIITGYQDDAAGGALVIPSKIEGYSVVAVRADVLSGFTRVFEYTNSKEGFRWLTDAEVKAKKLRPYITSVVFPDTITELDCYIANPKLTSIVFPKNVKALKGNYGGESLSAVKWPEALETIGGSGNPGQQIFKGAAFTELVIPEGVTYIGEQAFTDCKKLASLTLPASIKEIDGHAFSGCESLVTVTVPPHPIKYDAWDGAFGYCPKLNLASQKAIKDTGHPDKS